MIKYLLRIVPLFLLAIISFNISIAQQWQWPPKYWIDDKMLGPRGGWEDFRGQIIFKNNDTLKGVIRLIQPVLEISFLKEGKSRGTRFKRAQIRNIKTIELDTVNKITGSKLIFENLGSIKFYRLLLKCYDCCIYDRFSSYDGRYIYNISQPGSIMMLYSKGKYIKIYGIIPSIFHDYMVDELILKFINKRYKEKCTLRDFKNSGAMLDYLLAKENQKNLLIDPPEKSTLAMSDVGPKVTTAKTYHVRVLLTII
jgi:hypothetical protein